LRDRIGLETFADRQAVDAGQHQIEDNQVRRLRPCHGQRLLARLTRQDLVSFPSQVQLYELADILFVIDDQDRGL
jgi:hypothetical protein